MTTSVINEIGLGLLRQPKAVYFGPGQRAQIPGLVKSLGSNVLICTDERMATTPEFDSIRAALEQAGINVSVYARTEPDLPRQNILDVQQEFSGRGIEVVVGLGGGSCMDMAKVASLVLARGGDVRDYFGENQVDGTTLPILTVPTTGGTGAEVSCFAVVFDEERAVKVGVGSPFIQPTVAVIDPELTLTCPPGLTAATAADALSHLVESFTDRAKNPNQDEISKHLYVGKNILTDVYCREGLTRANSSMEAVANNPGDIDARSDQMFAAYCGGMALNTAGTAACHAIQSPIGNLTHTPHGFGVGALLPYVMRFNIWANPIAFAEMSKCFGLFDPAKSDLENGRAAIVRVEELLEAVGCPTDLKTLGLNPEDFDRVAEQAMLSTRLLANNPRELSAPAIRFILERGYENDRTWWDM